VPPALFVRPPEATYGRSATVAEQLYSASALLLWLVGGRPPFPGETPERVIRRHRSKIAPSLATMTADAPEALVRAVARSLRKDPAGRPTTLAVLREPLQQAAKNATWPAASVASPRLPEDPPRRRGWRLRLPFRR
jgi:serine/threonine-protein kinase